MLIGVVGKPNCGKSTFFKAATLAEVEIANRPFVTIKPNHGSGFVKIECIDNEFKLQCRPKVGYCLNNNRFVPVELLDVAGLVPGAHKGYGLGNQFLDDLRQADAFVHIIDASGGTNEKGESVELGSYDPANDIRFLETELDMWMFQIIKKGWEKFARTVKQENLNIGEELAKQLSGLKVRKEDIMHIIKLFDKDPMKWTDNNLLELAGRLRKTSKPMIIAANKADISGGMERIKRLQMEFPEYKIIPCSADSELALREAVKASFIRYTPGEINFEIIDKNKLNSRQQGALDFIKNFLKQYKSTGVQEILNSVVFELLKQIVVFPVENESKLTDSQGNTLPDAHILPNGSTAIELAERIHTDIAKRFNSAIDARTKKRLGRDYKLKHGDVIRIVIS